MLITQFYWKLWRYHRTLAADGPWLKVSLFQRCSYRILETGPWPRKGNFYKTSFYQVTLRGYYSSCGADKTKEYMKLLVETGEYQIRKMNPSKIGRFCRLCMLGWRGGMLSGGCLHASWCHGYTHCHRLGYIRQVIWEMVGYNKECGSTNRFHLIRWLSACTEKKHQGDDGRQTWRYLKLLVQRLGPLLEKHIF